MSETILVFDSSGDEIFLWVHESGGERVFCEHLPRRSLLTVLPERFAAFLRDTPIGEGTKVYLGVGPGSFTGIKSGVSLVGAFLYARGVFEFRCVSSLNLLVARASVPLGSVCLAVTPFREKELFAAVVRWERPTPITVVPPSVVSVDELGSFVSRITVPPDIVVVNGDLAPEARTVLESVCPSIPRKKPGAHLITTLLFLIPPVAIVDVRRDMLRLRYLVAPAMLPEDDTTQYVFAD